MNLKRWWSLNLSVIAVGAFLYVVFVLYVDRPLTLLIAASFSHHTLQSIGSLLSLPGGRWPLWLGGETLLMVISSTLAVAFPFWKQRTTDLLFMMSTFITSGLITLFIKIMTGRYRPHELVDHGLYGFHPFYFMENMFNGRVSSPSGHVQVIAAVALPLMFLLPRLRCVWLFVIAEVMVGRVLKLSHFVSDVTLSVFVVGLVTFHLRPFFIQRGES